MAASRRVAIVAPDDLSLANNRDSLIRALIASGAAVLTIAPEFEPGPRRVLNLMGAETSPFRPPPSRISLLSERAARRHLTQMIDEWRADTVLAFGLPTLVRTVAAARAARGVARIVSLVNMPVSAGDGIAAPAPIREVVRALAASDAIVLHNRDIERQLRAAGAFAKGVDPVLVAGGGIDLEHHAVAPLPPIDGGLVFVMAARQERSRGVLTFCRAAAAVKARGRRAQFILATVPSSAADAIPDAEIASHAPAVECVGPVDDLRPLMARSHVYVYPSLAEGMPRSVLAGLATGRPIITSDAPGCRETVDERVNGCLVPPGDVEALVGAIESFLKRPDLVPHAARASRLKAERRFDVREVDRALLKALGIA